VKADHRAGADEDHREHLVILDNCGRDCTPLLAVYVSFTDDTESSRPVSPV
jgi:hypothetical protein